MRAIVCGGRDFATTPDTRRWLWTRLTTIHQRVGLKQVITGGARGVDSEAYLWARYFKIPLCVVEADWKTHGKAAGLIRNKQMLDLEPQVVIAAPGGAGTAHMVSIARDAGVRVIMLEKVPPAY